jgi:hypothetical protein
MKERIFFRERERIAVVIGLGAQRLIEEAICVPFLTTTESAAAGIERANVPARTIKRPGSMKNFFIDNFLTTP